MSVSSASSISNSSSLQALLQQRKSDFKTLGSDVQSGNLSGAQAALKALQQDASNIQGLGGSPGSQDTGSQQFSQLRTTFANLISSIQAGSLSGAQTALSSLPQTQQSQATASTASTAVTGTSTATGSGSTLSSFGQDLTALIQAVQSGNLSGAQQDLTQLQSAAQNLANQTQDVQSLGHHHHHHHHGGDGGASNVASTGGTATGTSTGASSGTSSGSSSGGSSFSASAYASMLNLQSSSSVMSAMA